MYEKIALIALALFAVTRSEEVPFARSVKDAEPSQRRLSTTPLMSSYRNEQHALARAKAKRRSLYLLTPLSQTQHERKHPREATHKTKRCGPHLRSRSSPGDNVPRRARAPRQYSSTPYVRGPDPFERNYARHSLENDHATVAASETIPRETREENGALLRTLRDKLKANEDSWEDAQECNPYVCYCRPASRSWSSRLPGSPYRRTKPGRRTSHRRPEARMYATPYLLRARPPSLRQEDPYQAYVLDPANLDPMRFYKLLGTHGDFYAPILRGTPIILPHLLVNRKELAGVPLTFGGRPNFWVGGGTALEGQPSFRENPQKHRYLSERVRAENPTGGGAKVVDPNEENAATELPDLESIAGYDAGGTDGSGKTEGEVQPTERTLVSTGTGNGVDISPTWSTEFSVNYRRTTTESNFRLHSSDRTIGRSPSESFSFTVTPETHYASLKTDPEVGSVFSPYYPETTTMRTIADRPESRFLGKTASLWTTYADWPNAVTASNFDRSTSYHESTNIEYRTESSIGGYTKHLLPAQLSNGNTLSGNVMDENAPSFAMKKLTETADQVVESARKNLVGKSKSKSPMIETSVGASYGDDESTTTNPTADEGSLYLTTYKTIADEKKSKDFATTVRGDLQRNVLSSGRRFRPKGSARVSNVSQVGHVNDEKTAEVMAKSSRRGHCRTKVPRKNLVGARNPGRKKTSDSNGGDVGNDREHTAESLAEATADSPTNSRPPLFDTDYLLNSVRNVIGELLSNNDDDDDDDNIGSARTKDLGAVSGALGESLLPGILSSIPNLKDILPRMEDAIVQKVRDSLSGITNESRSDFTSNGLRGAIMNALRSLLNGRRDPDESGGRKPSSMQVEEHQFKHGHWQTSMVTLAPVANSSEQPTKAKGLREGIKNLLGTAASQADRGVARNMIAQGSEDGLVDEAENEAGRSRAGDPIIDDTLSDTPEAPRNTGNTSAKEKSDENVEMKFDDDDEDRANGNTVREETTERPISSGMRKSQEMGEEVNDQTMKTNYQRAKVFQSDLSVVIPAPPALTTHGQLHERENASPSSGTAATPLISLTQNPYEGQNSLSTFSRANAVAPDEGAGNNELTVTRQHSTSLGDDVGTTANLPEKEEELVGEYIPQRTAGSPVASEESHVRDGIARDDTSSVMEDDGTKRHDEATETSAATQRIAIPIDGDIGAPNLQNRGSAKVVDVKEVDATPSTEDAEVRVEETPSAYEPSRTSTQEASLNESSDVPSLGAEPASTAEVFASDCRIAADSLEAFTEDTTEEDISMPGFSIIGEALDESVGTTSLTDDEREISTDFTDGDRLLEEEHIETTERNAMDRTDTKYLFEYAEIDPVTMQGKAEANEPITFYSPKNRILDYIKTHHTDDESDGASTTETSGTSVLQKSSDDGRKLADATPSQGTVAGDMTGRNQEDESSAIEFSSAVDSNSVSSAKEDYEGQKTEAALQLTAEESSGDRSEGQQQRLTAGSVIKVHEVTTEVQKTHAKTIYYQLKSHDSESSSATDSLAAAYESIHVNADGNSDGDNGGSIGDKIVGTTTEMNDRIVSATGSSSIDDVYSLQLLPSSTITSDDKIQQLQKLQLYYVNDDVKLPLEIKRLKDGSYALSISKNICELILKRNCPTCVPLQGNVIQLSRRDVTADNAKEDCQSIDQLLLAAAATRNMPEETKERRGAGTHLSNDRRRRNVAASDNDDDDDDDDASTTVFSMPVVDFARKYNLLLDFDDREMSSKSKSHIEIRIPDDPMSLIEGNRLRNERADGMESLQDSRTASTREKKDILDKNGNLRNAESRETFAAANRSEITEIKEPEPCKVKNEYDDQNINAESMTNLGNQTNNFVSNGLNISEGESIFTNKEMESGNAEAPDEIEEEKSEKLVDDGRNIFKIRTSGKKNGRPYRYQRNTDDSPNKGVKIVKNLLYWLKNLFLDK